MLPESIRFALRQGKRAKIKAACHVLIDLAMAVLSVMLSRILSRRGSMTFSGEQGSSWPTGSIVGRIRKPDESRGVLDEAAPWPEASVSDFPRTRYGEPLYPIPQGRIHLSRILESASPDSRAVVGGPTMGSHINASRPIRSGCRRASLRSSVNDEDNPHCELKAPPPPVRHLEQNAAQAKWVVPNQPRYARRIPGGSESAVPEF